jgi:hypothetical protein
MTTVTLLRRLALHGGPAFNTGERIAVDDALAASLIAQGAARAYEAPPVHRMIDTAPIKKQSFSRKGRHNAVE